MAAVSKEAIFDMEHVVLSEPATVEVQPPPRLKSLNEFLRFYESVWAQQAPEELIPPAARHEMDWARSEREELLRSKRSRPLDEIPKDMSSEPIEDQSYAQEREKTEFCPSCGSGFLETDVTKDERFCGRCFVVIEDKPLADEGPHQAFDDVDEKEKFVAGGKSGFISIGEKPLPEQNDW